MKQGTKKTSSNKIFFAVFAVALSVLIWLYVLNVENDEVSHTVTGIEVNYIGEHDILSDRQLLVRDRYDQTISLEFKCRRNLVTKLTRESITINVDLTDILSPGVYEKSYSIAYPGGISANDLQVTKSNINNVKVTIDKKIDNIIEIRAKNESTTAEGYIMGDLQIAPDYLVIRGPAEIVNQVDHAEVTIKRENLSRSMTQQVGYILRDVNGEIVESNEIETDRDMVSVVLTVLMIKEVFFKVEIREGGGATEADADIQLSPPSVMLSGDPSILETFNTINLGSVRLDTFVNSYERTFQIDNIPNSLKNESGVSEVKLSIRVDLPYKRVEVSNIELLNKPEGYDAVLLKPSIDMIVRGPSDEIMKVQPHNIRAVCDLSEIGEPTQEMHSVTPVFYVDGFENVGVIMSSDERNNKVTVSLTKIVD